jgi:hypothetical protein
MIEQLEDRVSPEGLAWLQEAAAEVAQNPAAIAVKFPAVGRKVGRGTLDPAADPDDVHAWTVDDAARTVLLQALPHPESELDELYRYGDAAERRGILRALEHLDVEALHLVEDAIRTNDQAVLKCVFAGVPITPLDGLERVTPDGARMLAALVHERVAAGRDVPAEVWTVIDRHPPEQEIAAIRAELESPFEDRRVAAERALGGRP